LKNGGGEASIKCSQFMSQPNKGSVQERDNFIFKTFQEAIKLFKKYLNKYKINLKINLDTLDHDKKDSVVIDLIFLISLKCELILTYIF